MYDFVKCRDVHNLLSRLHVTNLHQPVLVEVLLGCGFQASVLGKHTKVTTNQLKQAPVKASTS
jgi:hypothetical protein